MKTHPINKKPTRIRRALISVYDKSNLIEFAQALTNQNVEIISTGGTARFLRDAQIKVSDVTTLTRFPEIFDGRVKTLHPKVEGGILGLRDAHRNEAKRYGVEWIDLVVCNLYPFEKVATGKHSSTAELLENVDIGGPTMIRAAAKNLGWVTVVVDPGDYEIVLDELKKKKSISFKMRMRLALKAFERTAAYDSVIQEALTTKVGKSDTEIFSDRITFTFKKHAELRYGENPHQKAASYRGYLSPTNNLFSAKIHQGKELSYNNIVDAEAALECLREFEKTACVIVKHSNPCGVAEGKTLLDSYTQAFNADSLSAFGGIVALNRKCTREVAEAVTKVFAEIVIAPSFEKGALDVFSKKKNLRVIEIGKKISQESSVEYKCIAGGILVQESNSHSLTKNSLKVVTEISPTEADVSEMLFGWKVLKHVKSNAIVITRDHITFGIGAGQVSRVDAVDIALKKGGEKVKGAVLCSDAFFPFRDSIDKIAGTGIRAVIQPGGSVRDQDVIDACNEHGIAMAFTGIRCFKH